MFNYKSVLLFVVVFAVFMIPVGHVAKAAITESGPPIYKMFKDTVIGPRSVFPLSSFRLTGDGATNLLKIGFNIRASSTMDSLAQISGIALYKESGANSGFNPNEDIYVPGSYKSSAGLSTTTMTILDMTSSPYGVPTSNSEFFIVASTSAMSNIINGNAFDMAIPVNYASTTAGNIGTAPNPMEMPKKFILQKTVPVKISEVKAGSTGNTKDEFAELYNPNDFYINLNVLKTDGDLALYGFNSAGGAKGDGVATHFALTFSPNKNYIAPFSYFLMTSATNYSGSVSPDAIFNNLTNDLLVANGGLVLATSTTATNATSSKTDMLCYGTQLDANCENSDTVGSPRAAALAEDGSSLERIAQGFPNATSTALSLASGGADAMKGNGVDRNDNSAEFVAQATANPQNTMSPKEMSFDGGFVDNSSPRVMGSYPQNGMINAPVDMPFIGFMFDKSLVSGTIASASATTSITLTPQGTAPAGIVAANRCSSVAYNPVPNNFEPSGKCVISGSLSPSTTYVFEIGTSTASAIRDISGNQADQDSFQQGIQSYTASFTTGASGQTMTNMAPPNVTGSMPFPGSSNIPTDIKKFFISFSQSMDVSTLTASNIKLFSNASGVKTPVSLAGAFFSYDATSTTLTISGFPVLANNTRYEINVYGQGNQAGVVGVKSANGVLLPMPQWMIPFGTGVADNTGPSVIATLPVVSGATGVPLNSVAFILTFNDHIDVSTATSGAVTLGIGGALVPSSFSYDPASKEGTLLATNLLPANSSMTLTVKGGSVKNISDTTMGSDYTLGFTTESSNSDAVAPSIALVNADDFGIAVTFNEAVNSTDAIDLSKYSITANSQAMTLSAMAGHSISYNAGRKTAKIQGVRMPAGSTFSVTASNIRDISGNAMTTSTMSGTVLSFALTGGMIDPGMSGGSFGTPPPPTTFTGAGGIGGFMPPANIRVMNSMTSASSTYGFEIPISTQIPANGQIVISFPSTSDFGLSTVATSSPTMMMLNDMNKDINGPGTGTIGIKAISRDTQSKTVTLTLDTATKNDGTDYHDFLRFGLNDIKNPSIPKGADTNGYALTIKTKSADGATILESSFNVNPVYIGGGSLGGTATTTIQGKIVSAYDGTTGLDGVTVMLQSPVLGPMPKSVDTSSGGNYSFTDLPTNNDYFLSTQSFVDPTSTTTDYFGFGEPSPMRATSTSIINRNISLTSTLGGVSFAVKLIAAINTFTSTEKLDIFAGGPGQFTVQTKTPGASVLDGSTNLAIINLPKQNGVWSIGIGPAMPKDGMMMGPPVAPLWVMPKPIQLNMTGCPGACTLTDAGLPKTSQTFTIAATTKTINGMVKDGSGSTIANAMIFAFSPSQGFGTQTQSDTSGKFSLNVNSGSYNVGAFFPGMGQSRELSVEVTSAVSNYVFVDGSKTYSTGQTGANPLVLSIKKPSYTITGKVSDGSNNIANAPVFAYRTDGPGNANAMTDSSGNYTLYVDNGSWQVGANVPGYGRMDNQSVTVASANQSGINFAPSGSTTYWSVLGTVFESGNSTIDSGEGLANVTVSARSSSDGRIYDTKTGSDGSYTLRVPQLATSTGQYILDVFKPGYGKIAPINESLSPIPKFGVAATTTWNIRINTRNTVTVNFKDASGNFITIPEAFIDLFDISKNSGNHTELSNGTSTSLQIPNMSSTTVRVFIPSVPSSGISYDTDNSGTTAFYDAGKTILNVDGDEIIKVVVSSTLSTVSGVVYQTSATPGNELKDVWVDVVNTSNGMHYGVSATSTNGYSLQLANGTYKIIVAKPGYIMKPQTLVVAGNATNNLVMASAGYILSGSVTAGGSAAPYAFVRAEKTTGGSAVTQADASGAYTLSVDSGQWRVYAASDKYSEAGYASNPISVAGSVSGINVALTGSAASIQDTLMTSNTFKDTASGSFQDTTVKTKVTIDSGALGQSGSDSYITAKETVNYPKTPSVNVIANKAKDISAYSGDSQVKKLSSGKTATIDLTYTTAELAVSGIDTPAKVGKLTVSTVNDQKEWESLNTSATYYDSNGNAIAPSAVASDLSNVTQVVFSTSEATHFSPYALTLATDPAAPSTPVGLEISTPTSASQLTIDWTANTESDLSGYYLYRSPTSGGSFALLATLGSGTISYTDTSLSGATSYYYKVAAYDSSNFESAASSEVSAATLNASATVGGVSIRRVASSSSSKSATTAVSSASSASSVSVANPSLFAKSVPFIFNRNLTRGSKGEDVRNLQKLLAQDKTIYPEGLVTGVFGPATEKAVKKFQAKYKISEIGLVGPMTRIALSVATNAISSGTAESSSQSSLAQSQKGVGSSSSSSVSVGTINKRLQKGMKDEQVSTLQRWLAQNKEIYPEGLVSGYFGSLTEKAVQRFQEKYGIVKSGEEGYGIVGPRTKVKLLEIFGGNNSPAR